MPTLKDYMKDDLPSFINTDEFGDIANIDGVDQVVVIDTDQLKDNTKEEYFGLTTGMVLYYIPVSAFSQKPSVGDSQMFNYQLYYVDDVTENGGMYEITLNQNRGE